MTTNIAFEHIVPVLFDGNCGSSWFCSELERHSAISAPFFEPLYQVEMAVLERFWDILLKSRNKQAIMNVCKEAHANRIISLDDNCLAQFWSAPLFCFKFRLNEISEKALQALNKGVPNLSVIWIHRGNMVRQALSAYKMVHLDISQFTRSSISEAVNVDVDLFLANLWDITLHRQELLSFYNEVTVPKIAVSYESLLKDHDSSMEELCRFLAIPSEKLCANCFSKVTNNDLRLAIRNYDELRQKLAEFPWLPAEWLS